MKLQPASVRHKKIWVEFSREVVSGVRGEMAGLNVANVLPALIVSLT